MPTPDAIAAHRNWWRQTRAPRISSQAWIPVVIRHGKGESVGDMAYAARLHAPLDVAANAFAHVAKGDVESGGDRWITVHPNGADQPGHPVRIKNNPDGTATIVGGVGGKLNGYRLSLVRSEEDYRQEIASRSKQEREQMRAEKQALIEAHGIEEYKRQQESLKQEKEQKKARKLEAAEHLARTVLTAQGVDADAILSVPDAVLAQAKNPEHAARIKEAHLLGVAKHARAVAQDVRKRVVSALEAQQPVEGVGFDDIVREALAGKTPGYVVNADRIAVERGIVPSADAIAKMRDASYLLRADGDESLAAERQANVARLQAGAAQARNAIKLALERSAEHGSGPNALAGIDSKPVGVENAGAILSAAAAFQQATRKKPSPGTRSVAPMSFDPMSDGDSIAAESVMDELRTRAVSKLVDMSNAHEAAGNSLYAHISESRYSALASIASEMLPGSGIDPALVDFLGSDGSAKLIATAMSRTRPESELQAYRDLLVKQHLSEQVGISEKAISDAQVLLDRAGSPINVDANSPQSVIGAFAGIGEKQQLESDARQRLGEARGKLEAVASAIKACDETLAQGVTPIRVIIPGAYDQIATMAAVVMPDLKLGLDYDIVSPASGKMAVTISEQGVVKLLGTSALVPSDDVAQRLQVVRDSAHISGQLPMGLRREIESGGPLHGAATVEYGHMNDTDRAVIQQYWAQQQGIDVTSMSDPFGVLTPAEDAVWRKYQAALGQNAEARMLQSELLGRFDSFANLDMDDDRQVVRFGHAYADVLGLDVVNGENGETVAVPAIDARKTMSRKARFLRSRIVKLGRRIWASANGAESFDPADVKPVSKAWSQFVQQSNGDMNAVTAVQREMTGDTSVMASAGKPLRLTDGQERMVSMIMGNRRMAAGLGAGAGKTLVMMGSFAHLKNTGMANRALIAVPSAVVGQFESEWNKFVDPRFGITMHAASGNQTETGHAMSGGADFVVMTHEGLRQRLLSACADEMGTTPEKAASDLLKMHSSAVDTVLHAAMHKNNWNFDYFAYDEGHKTLGRAGKEDSLLSTLLDSAARLKTPDEKLPYYVFATADPAKNDVSELHSLLGKIDPVRFAPHTRDAFVRSYGRNTQDCAVALRNVMSPYLYTQPVEVPVKQTREDVIVPLTDKEREAHDEIQGAYNTARLGRALGKPVEAAEQRLGATNPKALALSRDNAIARELLWSRDSSKAAWVKDHLSRNKGRGTVIFARNRASVDALRDVLTQDGHKVETLTGSDSGMSKRKKREAFQNEQHDILICTDAAEAGMNLQRGNLLINFDVPMTAKTLEQRIARQVRMGQTKDVDVYNLVSDCEWDKRNLARLKGKGALREIITSPFELSDDTGKAEAEIRSEAGV